VDVEVAEAAKKGDEAGAVKKECEDLLAEAIPALNAAIAALDTIKPADIKLVQTFKNPPAAVKLVMEAVCVALDVKPAKVPDPAGTGKKIDDYWAPSKLLLGEKDFVDRLRNYDKDNIEPRIIEKLREKYIADENFTPENAAKAASAAEGLCTWIGAMDSYDRVAKVVEPKKIALAAAEEEYNKIMAALKVKQDELDAIMAALAALEQQLEDSINEKKRLEDEVTLCEVKLERAEKLINGLGGQRDHWKVRAFELGEAYENLTGDMLISAGMISYLGTFTMAFRDGIADSWVEQCRAAGIPSSAKFSLVSCLGDPVAIREWGIAGLPNDSFSIDNGIMIANARRWPLMIDPQGQANKWVKNMEKASNLQVIKLTDGDYLRTLENAIQFGLPVLLENVGEELDPSLEPLLLKQLFKSGGVMCIKLGDSIIEFSDQFRFYITTSLRNPHYLPETAVKVTLLNFMITPDGLSDQLLGVVVAEERPDLESQRQELVVTSADNKKRLKEIEDRILHTMSSSEGNILDDAGAIEVLSEAKIVSDEISEKQKVADETQVEIDEAREGYKPCGAYNAVLFFTIRDLANIDPMYQYSLSWFIGLFVRSIHGSEKQTENLASRLDVINDHFTYSLYQNVCRSLFEKDKLLFSFLLDCRIMGSVDDLPPEEFSFFLTGGVGAAEKDVAPPAGEEWISPKMWRETCRLASTSGAFASLPEDMVRDIAPWRAVYDSSQPHREALPGKYGEDKALSAFQLLLLMRCLRPDKVTPAVNDFVERTMGRRFVEPPPFDLPGSYAESSCATPLLFVLSPGSDPTSALLKFAEDMEKADAISVISMGQGQGPKAAALIAEATDAGKWVLLQNCHLAPSWMPSLEKICEGITVDSADENFRLWLTSMPSPAFPVTILQNGIKMTNEPPRGLRANMRRSFQLEPIANPDFFESCDKPETFKKLCFGLAYVHGFVQERRSFGPIGWNIPYGFDDGDLRISARQLHMYVNDNKKTPFAALKYATGECNYGGRVTDDKDRRLLNTLLRKVYQPEALKDGFKLSDSGIYTIPKEGPHESYLEVISQFPILPEPEAFGLHANADITKDLGATALLTETLIKTGGGASAGGGGKEALVAKITSDILTRLPANFDIEAVQRKFPVLYEQSMNTVLAQEMLRYNRLLSIIRASLQSLEKAIAGLSVMSADLENVFNAFAIGQVPDLWMSKSFPSLKPLASYVEDLLARLRLFSDWYDTGQPSIFWISGFFFTPSFTTAALQNFARVNKLAIDTVGFEMEMLDMDEKQYTVAPEIGIYVYGMYLEGCAWDKTEKILCESRPKVLFEPAPCIWLKPVLAKDIVPGQTYSCPVYRTAARKGVLATTGHSTNFLMMMRMPTTRDEDHWTLRGVCMLCSLSD
jgi:dynein heavy chain